MPKYVSLVVKLLAGEIVHSLERIWEYRDEVTVKF
jgi:hypothetical protein